MSKKKSTLDIANAKKAKGLTRDDILIPVLAAWAHEEISIGCARDLLHMPHDKIKAEAEKRVSSAVKEREYRERLEFLRDNLAMLLRRALRRMRRYEMDVDCEPPVDHKQFMEKVERFLRDYGLGGSPLREQPEPSRCDECGYTETDARIMMDHRLCDGYGRAPWSKAVGEGDDRCPEA